MAKIEVFSRDFKTVAKTKAKQAKDKVCNAAKKVNDVVTENGESVIVWTTIASAASVVVMCLTGAVATAKSVGNDRKSDDPQ